MPRKVEIIESYIVDDNDYHWFDNYDELIRCKDCKNWEADEDERCMYCGEGILPVTEACMGYGFCSMAKPKETE